LNTLNIEKEADGPFSVEQLKKFNERIDKVFDEGVQRDVSQLQTIREVVFTIL